MMSLIRRVYIFWYNSTGMCRDKLFAELKEDILEMSKSKYAHFFVQKMLRYGTKEQRAHIFKTMEGNIAKVSTSPLMDCVPTNLFC